MEGARQKPSGGGAVVPILVAVRPQRHPPIDGLDGGEPPRPVVCASEHFGMYLVHRLDYTAGGSPYGLVRGGGDWEGLLGSRAWRPR
jgi:hypothetical protein